jgi:class 3 adenylate cyclase
MTPTTATILFVDIESFTKMCETLEPVDLSELLAYYYEAQCETVAEHGGVVDKFIGDCVMALWGAPRVVDSLELRAVCAGLHLRDNMKRPEAKQIQTDLGVDIKVRVGIAKGTVLAGSMRSTTRLAYTVLGDPVNLAARLEAANKKIGTRILINGTVMEGCVRDEHMLRLVYRDLGTVQVYGKDNAERVFQIIGVRSGVELGASSTSNKNPVIVSKEDLRRPPRQYQLRHHLRRHVLVHRLPKVFQLLSCISEISEIIDLRIARSSSAPSFACPFRFRVFVTVSCTTKPMFLIDTVTSHKRPVCTSSTRTKRMLIVTAMLVRAFTMGCV